MGDFLKVHRIEAQAIPTQVVDLLGFIKGINNQ
jgi:hypothetical protein